MVLVVFSQTAAIPVQCPSVLLQGAVLIWEEQVVEIRRDKTKYKALRAL